MIENNAKKVFNAAIERKKKAHKNTKVLVDKNNLDKLRADLDYVAMMCDVELEDTEEATGNEQEV